MTDNDLQLKGVQRIQLAMLKEFIRICEKYHLRYFLLGGSALGAVRHSGFVPWDDDIDVGMPRADYEKFLAVAQAELGENHFLQTYATDKNYPMNFAKIRNSATAFIQQNVAHINMNHGIFIDIFPLDGVPGQKASQKICSSIVKVFVCAILKKLNIKIYGSWTTFKSVTGWVIIVLLSILIPLEVLRRVVDAFVKINKYDDCSMIVNWYGAYGLKEIIPKSYLDEGRSVLFENVSVAIPKNHDVYLRHLYGDYMTPPSVENRASHHCVDIVDIENSYLVYR